MEEYARILSYGDAEGLREFVENEGAIFDKEKIKAFFDAPGMLAFGWISGEKIAGFAYGFAMRAPDGDTMFYLHSVDVLPEYQNRGRGSAMFQYIVDYAKGRGFSEVFLATIKSNASACRIYEKAGAKSDYDDEVVYVVKCE